MLPGASKAVVAVRFCPKAFGLRGLSTCKFLLVRAIFSMSQTNNATHFNQAICIV